MQVRVLPVIYIYLYLTFQASVNLDNLLKSRGIHRLTQWPSKRVSICCDGGIGRHEGL